MPRHVRLTGWCTPLLVLLLAPAGLARAADPTCDDACRQRLSARLEVSRGNGTIGASVTTAPSGGGAVVRGRSLDDPAAVRGGGDGGASSCVWRPIGPLAQVQAAQAALNTAQTPTGPADMPGVEANVPGMITQVGATTTWFEATPTTARVRADHICNGITTRRDWITLTPDTTGTLTPQVTADDLVPGAYDQVIRRLPTPQPHIGPADEDPDGYAIVNIPTYIWLDRTPGHWHPVTATATAAGITVTVTAQPVRLTLDPGNDDPPVSCTTFQPVLRQDVRTNGFPPTDTCSYRYTNSSATSPNGATWPLTTTITWHATWTATTGQTGDLGHTTTTSPPRHLPVAEIQAIITTTHD